MTEEKLELVTSFAQLRVGMKVVVMRPTCRCARHAGMLMHSDGRNLMEFPDGSTRPTSEVRSFDVLPLPSCEVFKHYRAMTIIAQSVADRKVYRVVDEQWDREQRMSKRHANTSTRELVLPAGATPGKETT